MNVYVVIRLYAYEGEAVIYAGNDWADTYSFAQKENEEAEDSRDVIIICTYTNGIEVDKLEL